MGSILKSPVGINPAPTVPIAPAPKAPTPIRAAIPKAAPKGFSRAAAKAAAPKNPVKVCNVVFKAVKDSTN